MFKQLNRKLINLEIFKGRKEVAQAALIQSLSYHPHEDTPLTLAFGLSGLKMLWAIPLKSATPIPSRPTSKACLSVVLDSS